MRFSDWSSDVASSALESQAEVSRNKGTHSRMAGLALRVFQGAAIWFTGNPVAVAVHAVTISWLTAVTWSGAGGARIIAASPVVAILRCPRSQYSDVHSNFLGVGDTRL